MPLLRMLAAALTASAVAAIAAGAAVWAGVVAVPLVRLPAPQGPWAVGTMTLAASAGDGAVIQVWFPARGTPAGRRAPYLLESRRSLRARIIGALVRTNAILNATAAPGPFPLIVYVPGWGGYRENNTAQLENFASFGYVVAAFSDASFPGRTMDYSSRRSLANSIALATKKLNAEVSEARGVIDDMQRANETADGPLRGRVDERRIGAFGFSFGGAVAAELTHADARVRAAINMDGSMYGRALHEGVARPFLLLVSSEPDDGGSDLYQRYDRENGSMMRAGLRRNGGYSLTIAGTGHYDFTDAAVLPSVRHSGAGPIGGRRAQRIVAVYSRAFFDRYLKDVSAPVFDAKTPFDQAAQLRTFPMPS